MYALMLAAGLATAVCDTWTLVQAGSCFLSDVEMQLSN
jgi:hypothetical protein